jgi:hypothetical protein
MTIVRLGGGLVSRVSWDEKEETRRYISRSESDGICLGLASKLV